MKDVNKKTKKKQKRVKDVTKAAKERNKKEGDQ